MNDGLDPGQRIGEYTLEERIGEGGFSTVWRAHHHMWPDRKVAAKVLHDSEQLRLLRGEGAALAKLEHPNIAKALGMDLDHDPPYLLVELHEGETLRDRLKGGKSVPLAETYKLFAQLVEGLAHSHAAGITHGDLKPENVLLDKKGHLKLTDFGLGRMRASEATLMLSGNLQSVEEKAIAGTIPYMAPEQRDGQPADPTSDVFALGIVLHEMITGRRPQPGDHPAEGMGDPPTWLTVWDRCYTRRDKRFKDATEILKALGVANRKTEDADAPIAPPIRATGPWSLEEIERAVAQEAGVTLAELLHAEVDRSLDPLGKLMAKAERLFIGDDAQIPAARNMVWYLAVRTMDVTHKQLADRYGVSAGIVAKGVADVASGSANYRVWRGVIDRLAPLPPSFVEKAKAVEAGKAGRIVASGASFLFAMFLVFMIPVTLLIAVTAGASGYWAALPMILAGLSAAFGVRQLRRKHVHTQWVQDHLAELPGTDERQKLTMLALHSELPVAKAAKELLAALPSSEGAPPLPEPPTEEEKAGETPAFEPPPAPGIDRSLEAIHRAMAEAAAEQAAAAEAEAEAHEEARAEAVAEVASEGGAPEGDSLGDLGDLGGSEDEDPTAKDAKDAKVEEGPESAPDSEGAVEAESEKPPRMPLDEAMRLRDAQKAEEERAERKLEAN